MPKEDVEQRLIDENRPITLLRYGKNTTDLKSQWQCHICDHKWTTSASNIFNSGTGCPRCADYGFNPGKPGYIYLHTFDGFIKIGITNYLKQRHKRLDNQIVNGTTYTIKDTMSWYFEEGKDAAELEDILLKKFKKQSYTQLLETSFDGRTELFESITQEGILGYIAKNYDISYA
jgi:hypothetical protein